MLPTTAPFYVGLAAGVAVLARKYVEYSGARSNLVPREVMSVSCGRAAPRKPVRSFVGPSGSNVSRLEPPKT
jgi:hypothetical protein